LFTKNAKAVREEPAGEERAVLDRLRDLDPDALTPKEALELLYRLRRQLDEDR
jgi:hypothetical protein